MDSMHWSEYLEKEARKEKKDTKAINSNLNYNESKSVRLTIGQYKVKRLDWVNKRLMEIGAKSFGSIFKGYEKIYS